MFKKFVTLQKESVNVAPRNFYQGFCDLWTGSCTKMYGRHMSISGAFRRALMWIVYNIIHIL